ncbi:hypothetical protein BGZ99_003433 [Dissophora globulifera]|uniref:Uncharacterized protein n=1 Tax=Dissophora globulifera TaxID=979702 RepID=A0A9P6RKI4_9FUNG|nr:hypothetical protein BGZ99_003433 [Dissophora globulifera]
MEDTRSFHLAGATQIERIPIQYVDGQDVVYRENIEQAFPAVEQVENGDVAIPHYIKYFPGAVLDVILSSTTEHLHVDSLVGTSNVVPDAAPATAQTVGLTDAHAGPTDALFDPLTNLPSEDKFVEDLQATTALAKTPIRDIQVHASSDGHSTLTALFLWRNSIGDNGAQALSEALKTNSTLITLSLGKNSIRHNGAQALSEALKINSTLINLNLENNWIGSKGAWELSQALMINSTLLVLDFGNNSIRLDEEEALSKALKTKPTLITLSSKEE